MAGDAERLDAVRKRQAGARRDAFLRRTMDPGQRSIRAHPMGSYLLNLAPQYLGNPQQTPASNLAAKRYEDQMRVFRENEALARGDMVSRIFGEARTNEQKAQEGVRFAMDMLGGGFGAGVAARGVRALDDVFGAPGVVTHGGVPSAPSSRVMPSEVDRLTGAQAGEPTPVAGPSFSSRRPSGVKVKEEAFEAERAGEPLTIDYDWWKSTPQGAQAAERAQGNPYIRTTASTPEGILDEVAEQQASNLVFLHDLVNPEVLPRSQRWYLGANRAAADRAARYGLPIENVAGAYAALSPQKDWFQNLELGDRLLDIYSQRGNLQWTPEMMETAMSGRVGMNSPAAQAAFQNIQGQPLAALTDAPEIGLWSRIWDQTYNTPNYRVVDPEGYKGDWARSLSGNPMNIQWGSLGETARAVDALRATNPQDVSRTLGGQHKVRSFGTNISNPMDPRYTTADTHAVAAGYLRPLGGNAPEVLQNFGSGVPRSRADYEPWMQGVGSSAATGYGGSYPLTQRGIELAGAERGVIPRGMQSITWEAGRNLFENQKSAARQAVANRIWSDYAAGNMSQEQAQQAIMNEFGPGGIPTPAWF